MNIFYAEWNLSPAVALPDKFPQSFFGLLNVAAETNEEAAALFKKLLGFKDGQAAFTFKRASERQKG